MNLPDFARAKRYFGRDDFWPFNRALRTELEALASWLLSLSASIAVS